MASHLITKMSDLSRQDDAAGKASQGSVPAGEPPADAKRCSHAAACLSAKAPVCSGARHHQPKGVLHGSRLVVASSLQVKTAAAPEQWPAQSAETCPALPGGS